MTKALPAFLLFLSLAARAQTWNGSVSSAWTTAANWTPATVPTSTSNVVINSAATPFKPTLPGNRTINSLNMTAGKLDLAGFTLLCNASATLDGDSLTGGKIMAPVFPNFADNRVVGKLTLEKTDPDGATYFYGNNRVYADSLILLWAGGTLYFDYGGAPDTVFGSLGITTLSTGSIFLGSGTGLRVSGSLVLNNPSGASYSLGGAQPKRIGGSIVYAGDTAPSLTFQNVQAAGAAANGPFVCRDGSIESSSFAGNFSFVADSSQSVTVLDNSFLGAANTLQAGAFGNFQNNIFNTTIAGTTTLIFSSNSASFFASYTGGTRARGALTVRASAPAGGAEQNVYWGYYGVDSVFGALTFRLTRDANLAVGTGAAGAHYTGGDLTIDADGTPHYIEFGSASTHRVAGSFIAQNFVPNTETLFLRNITASGTTPTGTLRCGDGEIRGCSFGGNFTLIADSAQNFEIENSAFNGATNFFQAGQFYTMRNNVFGQMGTGLTTHLASNSTAGGFACYLGNNRIRNNWNLAGSTRPGTGSMGLFPNYYSADSCLGTATWKLTNNTALSANLANDTAYVAGTLILDADGGSHPINFSSSGAQVIGGSLQALNFSANDAELTMTDVWAAGTAPSGIFRCKNGSINRCSFSGAFTLVADSAQNFDLTNSAFNGADNSFQAGQFYTLTNNTFGQVGVGTTTHTAASNTTGGYAAYLGDNRIRNNWIFNGSARLGSFAFVPNYYGADTCLGNAIWRLGNAANLSANLSPDTAYVAGNLIVDAQNRPHDINFAANGSQQIGGALQAVNFISPAGTLYLNRVRAVGTAPSGVFRSSDADINGCLFAGDFTLLTDSVSNLDVNTSSFLGAATMLRAAQMYTFTGNVFGSGIGSTTSIINASSNAGVYQHYHGANRFRGSLLRVLYAPAGGSQAWAQSYYAPDSVSGPLTLQLFGNSSAYLANQAPAFLGGDLFISNSGTGVVESPFATPVTFFGTDTASFSFTGPEPTLRRVRMNKVGGLRLLSPLTISTALVLDTGVILTTPANILTLTDNATATGLQQRSWVDGPMKKIGNDAFNFPVGNGGQPASIGITAPAASTDEFVARYFFTPPHSAGYDTSMKEAPLVRISAREYWTLDHPAGTSGVRVTLSYNGARSGLISNQTDLRVAHWKGTPPSWKNEGSGVLTGTTSAGTVQSANVVTTFSPFTLASVSPATPLPVEGIVLEAVHVGREARLAWRATRMDAVKNFVVERSADGKAFERLAEVSEASSGSAEKLLRHVDAQPLVGRNFYRIRAQHADGSEVFSAVRNLMFEADGAVGVYPNPATAALHVSLPAGMDEARVRVLGADGRTMAESRVQSGEAVDVAQLAVGLYWLEVTDGKGRVERIRFAKN